MKIESRREGGVTVLTLGGDIDDHEEFRRALDEHVRGGAKLCLNVGGVNFINSMAIGVLVETAGRVEPEGGGLVLSSPSTFFQTIIRTVGLDRRFGVYVGDAEAVAHFAGSTEGRANIDAPVDPALLGSTEMEFRVPGGGEVERGRILHVWKDGISFTGGSEIPWGTKVAVRFKQPFIDPNHVFDFEGEVAYAIDQDDGSVKVHMRYTKITDEDRGMIEDFVRSKDLMLPFLPKQGP